MVGASAAYGQGTSPRLTELSLEELGDVMVTSVSKQPEELWQTAAAIVVVTRDDIRRSGFTSLPEVLRLVPGVEVARVDSDHWSIGVRGLGDTFAKSLLVLVDGRSLYTPLFAGTYWPAHDVLLQDVDRIEVLRGPGGTIWGADAVTGVINIITRDARETHGLLASVTAGTIDRGVAAVRYGGGNGSTLDYRAYLKGFNRGAEFHRDAATFDEWWMTQGGFRADWKPGPRDTVNVQGDLSGGRHGQRVPLTTISPPSQVRLDGELHASGANVLGRWERQLQAGGKIHLQAYYDWTSWNAPHFEETRHTVDVDFIHALQPLSRHAITWGAGFRRSPGRFTPTIASLDFSPEKDTQQVASAFVQDEVSLVANRVTLTGGSKIEHNQYTGLEMQPNARVRWTPTPTQTVWSSISRAVRTPSRIERSIRSLSLFSAGPPLPIFLLATGTEDFESERLIGVEAGYRSLPTARLSIDIAAFHNEHRDLAAFGAATVTFENTPPPRHAIGTIPYVNGADGTSDGIEIAPDWRPLPWWRLTGSYSYVRFNVQSKPGTIDANAVTRYEGSSPRHQLRVDSRVTLPGDGELDVAYRQVSSLPARQVPAYHTADVRAGWRVSGLDLSLSGQNLLQPHHVEWGTDPATAVAISRSVALTVTWDGALRQP